jgi:hypothetical protein
MSAEPQPPNDTSLAAQRFLSQRLRAMPGWRKLALVGALNRTLDQLALSGLRQRYPQATPMELRRHLADIKLGPDLARRVYGPHGTTDRPRGR